MSSNLLLEDEDANLCKMRIITRLTGMRNFDSWKIIFFFICKKATAQAMSFTSNNLNLYERNAITHTHIYWAFFSLPLLFLILYINVFLSYIPSLRMRVMKFILEALMMKSTLMERKLMRDASPDWMATVLHSPMIARLMRDMMVMMIKMMKMTLMTLTWTIIVTSMRPKHSGLRRAPWTLLKEE